MDEIKLSNENLRNPETIKNLMSVEEGREAGLDEALSRILDFYRLFVPYS
ncbi:MAG: hypothetical protein NWF12_08485 [Candidatus Bathyarchaeota archaeon]|nr:hypothetical protein [Candidatus Bathyarchaeota archaeon]